MQTDRMTVRELVRAIKQRRACQHDNARAYAVAEREAMRISCPDCFRAYDADTVATRVAYGVTAAQLVARMDRETVVELARLHLCR